MQIGNLNLGRRGQTDPPWEKPTRYNHYGLAFHPFKLVQVPDWFKTGPFAFPLQYQKLACDGVPVFFECPGAMTTNLNLPLPIWACMLEFGGIREGRAPQVYTTVRDKPQNSDQVL